MRIYLIRHGQTEANENWLFCGATDLPLSEQGKELLRKLKSEGGYPAPGGCRIVTSGMKRTEETLEILYGALPHQQISALREMDFGAFEMRPYAALKNEAAYLEWISGDNYTKSCPDGESAASADSRARAAIHTLSKEKSDTIIITHGGVIAGIMAGLFPGENKSRIEWQPDPGKGYAITREESMSPVWRAIPEQAS